MMSGTRPVLGKVIRSWKARSSRAIRQSGNPDFAWQSRYFEHVIRSEAALHRLRRYISENPIRAYRQQKYT